MTLDEQYSVIEQNVPKVHDAGRELGHEEASKVLCDIIAGNATTVVIPYGCETIRGYAFMYSKNIKSVIVESKAIRLVGYEAFRGCESLEEFRIKEKGDIGYFSQKAFYKCPKLKVIDLSEYSDSDSKIPTLAHVNAFEGVHADCVIIVPAALYKQWISATNWSAVADMIVPDLEYGEVTYDIKWVGEATTDVTGFGASGDKHESVKYINVVSPIDGKTVVAIGDRAFAATDRYKKVTIDVENIVIGVRAFADCSGIESVVFKKSPKKIRNYAFYNMNACKTYDFSACSFVPILQANVFDYSEKAKILVPKKLYDQWISATNWSKYADRIVAV